MFKTHLKAFRNLLFPNLCFYCENKILDGYLCKRCREKITLLKNPLCYGCSRPLSYKQSSFCGQCQKVKPVCDRIISACAYKEPLAQLLQLFKYKHYDYLADFFASLLRDQIMASGINIQEYDTMMPVPCHPDTKKIRGYNQSFLLAKLLSNYFKISLENDIIQVACAKASQTKLLVTERQKNVEGAFKVKKEIHGKKIILVDDILTTGATIFSCGRELKAKGAKIVTAVTIAKTIQ